MLVLTRKMDEQILIGDDIRLTLIKTRGNTVRIGIEAPREIRVVRGELVHQDGTEADFDQDRAQPSDREQAFAHPPKGKRGRSAKTAAEGGKKARGEKSTEPLGRLAQLAVQRNSTGGRKQPGQTDDAQLFVGSVSTHGEQVRLQRTSLGKFMETT